MKDLITTLHLLHSQATEVENSSSLFCHGFFVAGQPCCVFTPALFMYFSQTHPYLQLFLHKIFDIFIKNELLIGLAIKEGHSLFVWSYFGSVHIRQSARSHITLSSKCCNVTGGCVFSHGPQPSSQISGVQATH